MDQHLLYLNAFADELKRRSRRLAEPHSRASPPAMRASLSSGRDRDWHGSGSNNAFPRTSKEREDIVSAQGIRDGRGAGGVLVPISSYGTRAGTGIGQIAGRGGPGREISASGGRSGGRDIVIRIRVDQES
jgi:hypothetical protein